MEQRNLLLNQLCRQGKTSKAKRVLKFSFYQTQRHTQRPLPLLLTQFLQGCNPLFKVRAEMKAGQRISHPIPLTFKEQVHHSMKLGLKTLRSSTPFAQHLSSLLRSSESQFLALKRPFHKQLDSF